jgi:hypothetical protein
MALPIRDRFRRSIHLYYTGCFFCELSVYDLSNETNCVDPCLHRELPISTSPVIVVPNCNRSFLISREIPNQGRLSFSPQIDPPGIVSISCTQSLPTFGIKFTCKEHPEHIDQIGFIFCVMLDIMNKSSHMSPSYICRTPKTGLRSDLVEEPPRPSYKVDDLCRRGVRPCGFVVSQ